MVKNAIRLHDRDLALLSVLAVIGLLDANTIWQRFFPNDRTGKACLRRLRLLLAHDLLAAIPVTVVFGLVNAGRPKRLFRLTERGAEVLSSLTGMPPVHLPRRDPRPETLLHRLGIARLRLVVDDACALQHLPNPRWIGEYDAVPETAQNAKLHERFVLCERFPRPDGGHWTCWPDASCCIFIPGPSSGETTTWHHLLGYWEFDRSSELLKQVARKVPAYSALIESGTFRKHWPDVLQPTVRVFFVVPSEERLRNVVKSIKNLPGADVVRLTTEKECKPAHLLTEPIWQTVHGERRPILRHPISPSSVQPK